MVMVCLQLSAALLYFGVSIGESLVHGRDAEPGELPYVARVSISGLGVAERYVAAGTLITTTKVLTTCDTVAWFSIDDAVMLHNVSQVTVSAGSVYRDRGGEHRRPSSSNHHRWCHHLASGTVLFNYGFFHFREPGFTLTEHLKPIDITYPKTQYALEASYGWSARAVKLRCLTAGWGYPTLAFEDYFEPDFFNSTSEVLQVINMTVVPYNGPTGCTETTCKEFDDCLINIWEYGLVCAKAEFGGPCRNDLGAPLICEDVLVGIHSNAQMCQDRGIPRHFSRLDLVYDYVFGMTAADATISSRDSFVFGNR